ncbi:ABC transporter substrate-binding protein [Candidatus Omnitrophota bacterium]
MKIKIIISLLFISFCFSRSATAEITQRIISLTPATTEILFALGLDNEIIGVTTFCNYPLEALSREKIGTFSQPDIEKIISLKPDIILATGLEQAYAVEKLRQLKLNVVVSHPSNLSELFASIEDIGKRTHTEDAALALVKDMKIKIETIQQAVKDIPLEKRKKVFIEIWHDPLMTAGNGSFVDELLTIAGGVNIARDTPRAYSYFSPEQVIERDPDCIILGYMDTESSLDAVMHRFGWQEIAAIQSNHVYNDINPDLFLRPGPRLVEGAALIQRKLLLP